MSSSNTFMFSLINSSRLVGVAAAGLIAGYDISVSHGAIPSHFFGQLTPEQMIPAWHAVFIRGAQFIVPLIFTSTTAFWLSAYQRRQLYQSKPLTTIFGLTEPTQLVLAGALVFAAIPWTSFVMMSNIKALLGYKKRLEAQGKVLGGEKAPNALSQSEKESIAPRVWKWAIQNNVRTALFLSAFVLGLTVV